MHGETLKNFYLLLGILYEAKKKKWNALCADSSVHLPLT